MVALLWLLYIWVPNCASISIKYSRSSSEFGQLNCGFEKFEQIFISSPYHSPSPSQSVFRNWLIDTSLYSTNQLFIPFSFWRWINDSGIAVAVWISTTIPSTRFQLRRLLLWAGILLACHCHQSRTLLPSIRQIEINWRLSKLNIFQLSSTSHWSRSQRMFQPRRTTPELLKKLTKTRQINRYDHHWVIDHS